MPVINKSKINIESVFYGPHCEPATFCSAFVNVKYEPSQKNLATVCYCVRAVTCKRCDTELGWFHEFPYNPSERYKENNFVLLMHAITIKEYGLDGNTVILLQVMTLQSYCYK